MNTENTLARADRPLIMVEVGVDRLKMMRTVPGRGGPTVANLHVETIRPGDTSLGLSMARVIKTWPDHKRTPSILCLPRQMVTIRNLELPSTDPAEIDDMIAIQAAKLTPWSREEVLSDYRLLESAQPGYQRVMLVIAQRAVLRQRFYLAEEAGLDPERLTISTEGLLLRTLDQLGEPDETVAVLDVDSFYADFMVTRAKQAVFSRSILTGANDLNLDAPAAIEKISREVVQSLELADREAGETKPARIILSGAAIQAQALAQAVREKTGLPCDVCDPQAGVKFDPAVSTTVSAADRDSVSLSAMLGMASDPGRLEINLVPESVRMRRELGKRARVFSRLGMAVMSFLLAASMVAHVRYLSRLEQLRVFREAVARTDPDARGVARRLAIVQQAAGYLDPRLSAAALLDAVHPGVPPDVALEGLEIDVDQKRLTISGTAPSIRDVRTLVNQIEALPHFKGAREDGAMSQDARTGRFKFKVVCPLEI